MLGRPSQAVTQAEPALSPRCKQPRQHRQLPSRPHLSLSIQPRLLKPSQVQLQRQCLAGLAAGRCDSGSRCGGVSRPTQQRICEPGRRRNDGAHQLDGMALLQRWPALMHSPAPVVEPRLPPPPPPGRIVRLGEAIAPAPVAALRRVSPKPGGSAPIASSTSRFSRASSAGAAPATSNDRSVTSASPRSTPAARIIGTSRAQLLSLATVVSAPRSSATVVTTDSDGRRKGADTATNTRPTSTPLAHSRSNDPVTGSRSSSRSHATS